MPEKPSERLLKSLSTTLHQDEDTRLDLINRIKGVVLFRIDGKEWVLDLRDGKGSLTEGPVDGVDYDIELTIGDADFVKMVMGQLGPQQAFLFRKLKIKGSMALAMKLQPILDAAAPKAKM